ncbi:hypothetical protein CC78DRAFT_537404 [Lojkania enalia]|uniref:Secreted protein n=1 Tax=Lojkania enalia TaxID=147567 RepID=A0A9P4K0D9_9PLEO|nr:hypothetical protein CC78DRAFT_537404 [Didymosphaeria enalia]
MSPSITVTLFLASGFCDSAALSSCFPTLRMLLDLGTVSYLASSLRAIPYKQLLYPPPSTLSAMCPTRLGIAW